MFKKEKPRARRPKLQNHVFFKVFGGFPFKKLIKYMIRPPWAGKRQRGAGGGSQPPPKKTRVINKERKEACRQQALPEKKK